MKTYALACDLDGTLIKHNNGPHEPRTILKEDIERIQNFVNKGNLFIVSTGRIRPLTFALFDTYAFHPHNTYYIASNGAEIYDQDRNLIYDIHMSYEQTKEVYKQYKLLAKEHPLLFQVYDGINNYCLKQDDELPLLARTLSICIESELQDSEQTHHIYEQLKQSLTNCDITINNWFINVIPQHISKASAINYILGLQDKPYILYAIGDSYNDTTMFSIADESYTFYNSPEDIKQKAKHLVHHLYACIDEIDKQKDAN